ncbi:Colanic acid biosynthesis protein wcaM [Salmonella enterica subsp. arizonae]|uniref:Colanic acid biosynthesis protein wcaM n=1 Tax=Salmonella enterica subsp. arizonae TaxID=59203 RepID=A0A3S4G0V5_SALER|nr:Colanic acid biosynthesis protein wcaM [Salmonella enterica subsp. arizonae]
MPANKFSRRTLLTAGSALAVIPFLRALPVQAREPRQTVDIKDYPAGGWYRLVQTGLRRRTDRGRAARMGL